VDEELSQDLKGHRWQDVDVVDLELDLVQGLIWGAAVVDRWDLLVLVDRWGLLAPVDQWGLLAVVDQWGLLVQADQWECAALQ